MAKKIHLLRVGSIKERKLGVAVCGAYPRSKSKGTIMPGRVTCSNCLRKMDRNVNLQDQCR